VCIILDVNILPSVFSRDAKNHSEFKPVYDWILGPNGKVVFGGTKYWTELSRMKQYLALFSHLNKKNKVVILIKDVVDDIQEKIDEKIYDLDFDDPHIIAIVIVSKCGIICSDDKKSYKFIKNNDLYPPGVQVPRIYSNVSNKDLLNKKELTKISYKYATNF